MEEIWLLFWYIQDCYHLYLERILAVAQGDDVSSLNPVYNKAPSGSRAFRATETTVNQQRTSLNHRKSGDVVEDSISSYCCTPFRTSFGCSYMCVFLMLRKTSCLSSSFDKIKHYPKIKQSRNSLPLSSVELNLFQCGNCLRGDFSKNCKYNHKTELAYVPDCWISLWFTHPWGLCCFKKKKSMNLMYLFLLKKVKICVTYEC